MLHEKTCFKTGFFVLGEQQPHLARYYLHLAE